MKEYELTVVIHPDLEMNLTPATDKVEKLIKDNGGEITKETNEGKKHLSYQITKQDFGVYYYYEVSLPADAPRKITNALNITDEVIRYLLVSVDPRKAKMDAKRKAGRGAEDEDTEEDEEAEDSEGAENVAEGSVEEATEKSTEESSEEPAEAEAEGEAEEAKEETKDNKEEE